MTAHRSGDFNTKLALHEKYYSETSAALMEHVNSIIEEVDKVIEKSRAHPVYIKNEHPRLPLIQRHNEFVRETFDRVRRRYGYGTDLGSPEIHDEWCEAILDSPWTTDGY